MSGVDDAAQRLGVQLPALWESIDKPVLVSKCQRSCRASEAQRVGWNALLAGVMFYQMVFGINKGIKYLADKFMCSSSESNSAQIRSGHK